MTVRFSTCEVSRGFLLNVPALFGLYPQPINKLHGLKYGEIVGCLLSDGCIN